MLNAIKSGLRMAGQKVRAFDDEYGKNVAKLIAGEQGSRISRNPLIGAPQAMAAGVLGSPAFRKLNNPDLTPAENQRYQYAVPAAAGIVRYGLPTLGAVAISEGVEALYQVAEETPLPFVGNPDQDPRQLQM